jgi:hypothetical protein
MITTITIAILILIETINLNITYNQIKGITTLIIIIPTNNKLLQT